MRYIDQLRTAFPDRLHLPGDQGYDAARLPWRRNLDPRPAAVVEAAGPRDVRDAIGIARRHDLPFAVQSTGHGTLAACDGGLLLKTARMASVVIDPGRRVARVGGGTLWGDVVAAAAAHGLAPVSGSSPTVGVAGFTLGGGLGWLSGKYGYAADSLLAAEVVTAAGDLVTASPREHTDLFWALRGGGGAFGVVTSLELRLFPVAQVTAGMLVYGFERAAPLVERYREWAPAEPEESSTALLLARMPGGPPMTVLRAFHLGTPEEAAAAFAPLTEAAGPPVMGALRQVPYPEVPEVFGHIPPPTALETRLDLFHDLPPGLAGSLVAAFESGGPVAAAEIRHWGGAGARPGPGAGPAGHRGVPFSVLLGAPYQEPGQAAAAKDAVRDLAAELRPHATGGTFLNFLTDPARTRDAYTPDDYARLAAVKKSYDPDNFLRIGHNFPPSG